MYIMAKGQDWTMWIVGGIIAALGYFYITSQKANGSSTSTPLSVETQADVAHSGGCGCGV